jgi:NAD+ kinase
MLARALDADGIAYRLHPDLAAGLAERGLLAGDVCADRASDAVASVSDVLLSFGGDGTLLRSAHLEGGHHTPILGVNMGRLGFLTTVEVGELREVVAQITAGGFGVERRMALDLRLEGAVAADLPSWALNDIVVDKSGTTSMIQIETQSGGRYLNTYWADGLIAATPTGSTAYALSVGGPILSPGTDAVVVAPIAPHTLTARPIVLPADAELTLRVATRGHPFAFACDGISTLLDGDTEATIRIRRSAHEVAFLTLADRDYFSTIRSKLSWGQGGVF